MATIISMWFMLQADIEEAKKLPVIEIPPPEVTRMEFDMKDQMIRNTILTTQEDVKEIISNTQIQHFLQGEGDDKATRTGKAD